MTREPTGMSRPPSSSLFFFFYQCSESYLRVNSISSTSHAGKQSDFLTASKNQSNDTQLLHKTTFRQISRNTSFSPLIFFNYKKTKQDTMAELMFGLGQTKKKKETEQKVRTTKANLKDVTITEV
jgi:hypothetical protein